MQQNLQRFFPLVTLAFVAAAAYMCAELASLVIARSLWAPEVATVSSRAEGKRTTRAEPLSAYRPITERNLFNSKPTPAGKPTARSVEDDISSDAPQLEAPAPAIKLVLVAVTVGGPVDLAAFEKEGEVEIFATGEEIAPGYKLARVKSDRAFVAIDGKESEYLLFTERPDTKKSSRPTNRVQRQRERRPRTPARSNGASTQFDPSSIRKVADNSWVIDRGQVEQSLGNLSELITEVRVIPNLNSERQADGFKVFEIKPASIFARLGVRNGDIVKEVNGLKLNGIDQAYKALSQLQNESAIQINLVRRNRPITLSYEIR